MTRKQLTKAMRTILMASPNLLQEGETVDGVAGELATDELLILMNADLWPVFVVNSNFSIARSVSDAENAAPSRPVILPKIWPRPAVCVGEMTTVTGSHDGLIYTNRQETYIDETGEVFSVGAYNVIVDGETDFTVRQILDTPGPMMLNRITEFLPERFSDYIDL